ncbi:MAG: AI-2E family transporter [Lacunisphaera sp.]|nr:AI-2E family transporter [Lacunisphaera sp.]
MNEPIPQEKTDPASRVPRPRMHVRTWVLLLATAGGVYLCCRMAVPFLPAGAWALTLAVLFMSLQRWLESKFQRRGVAALIAVVVIGLIVVIPALVVAQQLVVQAANGAALFEARFGSGEWRHALEAQPRLAELADTIQRRIDLPGMVKSLAAWLSAGAGALVKGSVYQVIGLVLTFYLLFFFLRDRRAVLQSLRSLMPLPAAATDRLFRQVDDTIHATVYGTLAVALLQGALGGLMFWWLGVTAALFWGGMMALFALIPVLGAFVVWLPVAFFLAAEGHWGKALVLTLWGTLVVGTVDNLLRPILVGNRLRQHTVLAFMSVVGGIIVFGPAGLILGPVTLTVTMALLEFWRPGEHAVGPVPADETTAARSSGGPAGH